MKHKLSIVTVVLCLLATSVSFADSDMTVTINGKASPDLKSPIISSERALLPARSVFEFFGFEMQWKPETKVVTAKKGTYEVLLTVDKNEGQINGDLAFMDQPPKIVNGSTYVPLRFVAEALGAEVGYNGETRSINIDTSKLDKPVVIEDTTVKTWLEKYYGKTDIRLSDMYYVVELDASRSSLYRLDALTNMPNLKRLNLSQNSIEDITPLLKLKNLQTLNLSYNQIRIIDGITDLPKLKELDIRENRISSFQPFAGKHGITSLKLLGNATQNYAPLYFNLGQFTTLDVDKTLVEAPATSTQVLNAHTSFEVAIDPQRKWVSASRLGGTSYKEEDLTRLLNSQRPTLQNHLDSVYEVLQVLQSATDWTVADDFKIAPSEGHNYSWRYQDNSKMLIETHKATSYGVSSFVQEALAGDYVETGMLIAITDKNEIKAMNYVKVDRREEYEREILGGTRYLDYRYVPEYYSFDPSAYCLDSKAIYESGKVEEFIKAGTHRAGVVKTDSLEDYASFVRSASPDIKMIVKLRSMAGVSAYTPIDVTTGSESGYAFIPKEYEQATTVLYQEKPYTVEFVENASKNPFYY